MGPVGYVLDDRFPCLQSHQVVYEELRKATENISKDGFFGAVGVGWALGVGFQRLRLIDSVTWVLVSTLVDVLLGFFFVVSTF